MKKVKIAASNSRDWKGLKGKRKKGGNCWKTPTPLERFSEGWMRRCGEADEGKLYAGKGNFFH
jgi:hypothetical protein